MSHARCMRLLFLSEPSRSSALRTDAVDEDPKPDVEECALRGALCSKNMPRRDGVPRAQEGGAMKVEAGQNSTVLWPLTLWRALARYSVP